MIEYKGYVGIFEFDEERQCFYGKVTDIEDLITFQGKSVVQVKEAFEDAVNEYLVWCKKYRTDPKKPRVLKEKDIGGGGSN